MNIKEYPDRDMLAIDLANRLAGELKSYLLHNENAVFAVPGGTTPGAVFDALCAADLDWNRVLVLPTDERWVPEDDARSNARLIRKHLLVGRAADARFMSLDLPGKSPEEAAATLGATLQDDLPIAVLLMGMGADMHVASLFPGAPELEAALDANAPPLMAMHPDAVPEPRISLTAPVLDGALSKHLVIYGEDKRAALERAMSLPPEEAPVQAVLSETQVHWAE